MRFIDGTKQNVQKHFLTVCKKDIVCKMVMNLVQ